MNTIKGQLDKLNEPFVITDENGIIQYANSAKTYITGYDVPEMIDSNPGEL